MIALLIVLFVGFSVGMMIGYLIGVESGLTQAFSDIRKMRLKPDNGELSPAERRRNANRPWS